MSTLKYLLILSAGLAFLRCGDKPSSPDQNSTACRSFMLPDKPVTSSPLTTEARYNITFPDTSAASPLFRCTFSSGNSFLLPVHFADNPPLTTEGLYVRDIHITDNSGNDVATALSSTPMGPLQQTLLTITGTFDYPVTISYLIDFQALVDTDDSKASPDVFFNDTGCFFSGAHCFVLPYRSADLATQWRTPFTAQVLVNKSAEKKIFGIPSLDFTCATAYELLFLQFSQGAPILTCGNSGGVDFIYANFTETPWSRHLCDSIKDVTSLVLDYIAGVYGPFSHQVDDALPYTIAVHSLWGGLEGTFGFAIREPFEGTDQRFVEILAHEALHHFIGIHTGDLDDPWWKEAAAAYLGVETAVALGGYPKDRFRTRMTTRFYAADSLPFQRALSDPWLREYMFSEELHNLAYDRGGQIMMLFDEQIRNVSENTSTLHHAIADLCQKHKGGAFSRTEFRQSLVNFGATGADSLFSTYVDRGDMVPSVTTLTATFNRLDSLAAW